jgi:hypothetical protein
VPFEHLQDGITLRRAAGQDEEEEEEEGDTVTASYFVCKLKVVLPQESDGAYVVVMACFIDTLPLSSFPPQPAPPSRLPASSSSSACPSSSQPVFCTHDHDVCLVDACAAATAADRSDRTTRGGGKDEDEEEEGMGGGGGWCATDVVGDDGGWLPQTMLMSPPSSSSSMIVPVASPPSSYHISSPLLEVAKRLLPLLMGALVALLLVWLFMELDAESDLAAGSCCPAAGLMCEADTLSSELGGSSSSAASTGLLEALLVPLGLGSGAVAFLSAGGEGGRE